MDRLKSEINDLRKDQNTLMDNIDEKDSKIQELTEALESAASSKGGHPPTYKPPLQPYSKKK